MGDSTGIAKDLEKLGLVSESSPIPVASSKQVWHGLVGLELHKVSRWKITRRRPPPTQGSPASINLANWTWGGLCLNWPWPRAPPHPRSSSSLAHRSCPPHRLWRSHPIRMIYAWLPSDDFLNVLFCSDCERNRKDHKLQVKSFQKPQVGKGECWLRDLRGWSGGDSLPGSCKLDVNFIPFHLRIQKSGLFTQSPGTTRRADTSHWQSFENISTQEGEFGRVRVQGNVPGVDIKDQGGSGIEQEASSDGRLARSGFSG